MKTKTTAKTKVPKADAPMTRNEFKEAISKMTRSELIGLICDIYYANAKDGKGAKGGCECDCGCGSGNESKKTKKTKTPKRPKSKVSKVSKSKIK